MEICLHCAWPFKAPSWHLASTNKHFPNYVYLKGFLHNILECHFPRGFPARARRFRQLQLPGFSQPASQPKSRYQVAILKLLGESCY